MSEIKIPKFIKWVGGKQQLIEQFKPIFPQKIDRYFEPFLGGGAIAFYILKKYHPKEIILSDLNEELINVYKNIKSNVEPLIEILKDYKEVHDKNVYYKIREQDPTKLPSIHRAARFIYLNKTCFNGLYRVNSQGKFNVPMGSYKNPKICPEEELREIAQLLNNVKLLVMPFEKIFDYAKEGDFIYFDPPYYPLKKGKSFTTYTKENFLDAEQELLAKIYHQLDQKGCRLMLSNSDTSFIKKLYNKFNINNVRASRMINSKGDGRGKINELVITNYPNTIEV